MEDPDALLGLEVADSVHDGPQVRLVTVTNKFSTRRMQVTVALQDDSDRTLFADGESGSSVTFWLWGGEALDVEIDVSGTPETISFDVDAQADGVSISVPGRETDVTSGQPPCAGPPPQRPDWC